MKHFVYFCCMNLKTMNNTIEKINNLVESGKVYEYAGRCWFTAYMTWTKLRKSEKEETILIEGTANGNTHYWLEVNGVIVDPHYKLVYNDLDVELELEYVKEREYNLYQANVNRDWYSERPATNWLGREKWTRVYDLGL